MAWKKLRPDKADTVFSVYIRTRDNWTCQRCSKVFTPPTMALHNSHFFGRARENTRFDPENCDALCYGCHQYWGSAGREDYRDFKIQQLSQHRFDELTLRSNSYRKKDRKASLSYAQGLLDSLLTSPANASSIRG